VTWFVTRRTTRRHHLLSPDEAGKVEQLYWYTTAVFAKKYEVGLHMVQLMSTHPHETLTDTRGVLPLFNQRRNCVLARALKVLLGWPEEVFSKTPACWVELPTAKAVIKAMGYTGANCVAAGLVRSPEEWPGAKVLPDDIGNRVVRVERPDFYFDPNNPDWPDVVEIPIVMPQLLLDAFETEDAAREAIQAELDAQVHKAHHDNMAKGREYADAKQVIASPHTCRASSYEKFGSRIPTFAAAGDPEVARTMVRQRRAFLWAYRKAWLAWRAGDHSVIFPAGTWKMRVYHAARCAPWSGPPGGRQAA
jgi:hypothetical protein